jgi:hypothetical protein
MPRRIWVPPEPYDLALTLRVLRRVAADPTCRREWAAPGGVRAAHPIDVAITRTGHTGGVTAKNGR